MNARQKVKIVITSWFAVAIMLLYVISLVWKSDHDAWWSLPTFLLLCGLDLVLWSLSILSLYAYEDLVAKQIDRDFGPPPTR